MNLLERMKHYNFWVALTMAVIILLNTISDAFNLDIDDAIINDIIMAILGIMVVLGFVQKDGYNFVDTSNSNEMQNDSTNNLESNTDKDNVNIENDIQNTPINENENKESANDDFEEIDIDKIIQDLKNDMNHK